MNRSIIDFLKIPESIRIPYFGGKWYRLLSELDNKSIAKERIPCSPLNTASREEKVTVSLTSFPARIEHAHLSIKSLMLQSYAPDRIVLWLSKEQFPDEKLPESIVELKKHGLEVVFCDDNLYGHKKYFISLMEQKENELVVTYDDDIIYPPHSLWWLIKMHRKFPGSIICNRAQAYIEGKNGEVINPGGWRTISSEGVRKPSFKLCPSTGGGCLYPCGALHKDASDAEKIKKFALRGDDLWIMFMALENGTSLVKTRKWHKIFTVVRDSQSEQLATGNIVENGYVDMLHSLCEAYPDAWSRITSKEDK